MLIRNATPEAGWRLPENGLPQHVDRSNVPGDAVPLDTAPGVGAEALGMLQAAEFAVGVAGGRCLVGGDQAKLGGDPQQGDVAEVAGQALMAMGVAEHQILDDEFDVDDAAGIMLEVELAFAIRGVRVNHLPAHGDDFIPELVQVALLAEDFAADFLEAGADRRVAGAEAGAGQRLMFPDPGVLELVVAEGIDRDGKQAGIAVGTQAEVGLEQDAGRGLARSQVLRRWPRWA